MTSIVVLGQPYWGSLIAKALDGRVEGMHARFVDPRSYAALLARPPRFSRVILIRAGFRTGGTSARGRLFDAYWAALRRAMPRARACHYWLGTDVLDTVAASRSGTLRRGAFARIRDELNVADAPWLATELAEVGVLAHVVHVPQPYRYPDEAPPLPSELRVLTYLPGDRFAFYGGDIVMEAARRLPDVGFDVVGRTGSFQRPELANVTWHGWVAGMTALYARCVVVVRIPRHDGLGATVVEGLLHGRHVIYSHGLPFVRQLAPVGADALVAELEGLRRASLGGSLALNLEGRAYAIAEYDETRLASRLAALLQEQA